MTATETTDGRRNQTRVKLLEGALRLLVEEGFEAATTGRIAKEAGIKQSSFYSHFESRDACLAEAIRTEGGILAARMAERRAGLPSVDVAQSPDSLKAGMLMALLHLGQNPNLARGLVKLLDTDGMAGDAVRAVLGEMRDAFIADLPRFGVVAPSDAAMRVDMLFAMTAQAAMGLRRGEYDLDTVANLLVAQSRALFPPG